MRVPAGADASRRTGPRSDGLSARIRVAVTGGARVPTGNSIAAREDGRALPPAGTRLFAEREPSYGRGAQSSRVNRGNLARPWPHTHVSAARYLPAPPAKRRR